MPVPTSYTEQAFGEYLKGQLGNLAEVIGWPDLPQRLQDIVTETLIAYGVTDISNATEIGKLRAFGRLELWKAAADGLTTEIDYSADATSFKRSQIFDHVQKQLQHARLDAAAFGAAAYDASYTVSPVGVYRGNDPYRPTTQRLDDLQDGNYQGAT